MRHGNSGRKLGKKTAHREAMLRNMAASLIQHGRIRTTIQKAKELRVFAENLVTLGKKDTLHARRLAFDRLRQRDAVTRLFDVIAPAFKSRAGGYTRIYRLGIRPGDAADMALIEYLREDVPAVTKGDKDQSKKDAAAAKKEKKAAKPAKAPAKKATKADGEEPKAKKAAPRAKKKTEE